MIFEELNIGTHFTFTNDQGRWSYRSYIKVKCNKVMHTMSIHDDVGYVQHCVPEVNEVKVILLDKRYLKLDQILKYIIKGIHK